MKICSQSPGAGREAVLVVNSFGTYSTWMKIKKNTVAFLSDNFTRKCITVEAERGHVGGEAGSVGPCGPGPR